MKRLHSTVVRLPALSTPDLWDHGLEGNLRAYDYGKRTAVPVLDDYVLTPFGNSLKDAAFMAAEREVGIDGDGVLRQRYTHVIPVGNVRISVSCYPVSAIKYEAVLARLDSYLEGIIADNQRRLRKTGVRKVGGHAYVSVEDLIEEATRLISLPEHKTRLNRRDIEKFREPDGSIAKLRVYLDASKAAEIHGANADRYHQASSLKARVARVMNEFKTRQMEALGITDNSRRREEAYELGDGTGARVLFFPQSSTEYGKVFDGLVGAKGEIGPSSGDLEILRELAFRDDFSRMFRGTELSVTTQGDESGSGMTTIRRSSDIVGDGRVYPVFRTNEPGDNRVFVMAETVQDAINNLARAKTKTRTEMKVDFFPRLPELES